MSNHAESGKCLIISGGEFAPIEESAGDFDLIIACDKGLENARMAGIRPALVIGDFDSYKNDVNDIPVIRLPVMKDDTDTVSAVKYAIGEGFTDITVSCAFGGRFDHSIANLQTAAYIAERGCRAKICGKDTILRAVKDGGITIQKEDGYTLSVFSLSDRCENVSIYGTLYTVEKAVLTNSFPLGVSNSWTAESAHISVGRGTLIIILSRDN